MAKTKKKVKGDQNRRTPPWLFDELQLALGVKFKVDVFASPQNALCKRFITEQQNALMTEWGPGPAFGNPPFKMMGAAICRAVLQAKKHDMLTVILGPTGCSQTWFHNYAKHGTIWVPNQRIVFYDSVTGKPTPGADRDTMVYIFGPGYWNKQADKGFKMQTFNIAGKVITAKRSAA